MEAMKTQSADSSPEAEAVQVAFLGVSDLLARALEDAGLT
jgi:hypothetical protein